MVSVLLWVVSVILALLAVSAAPTIITYATRLFFKYGRRYPILDTLGTLLTWALVGGIIIFLVGAVATFFHHLFVGIR